MPLAFVCTLQIEQAAFIRFDFVAANDGGAANDTHQYLAPEQQHFSDAGHRARIRCVKLKTHVCGDVPDTSEGFDQLADHFQWHPLPEFGATA